MSIAAMTDARLQRRRHPQASRARARARGVAREPAPADSPGREITSLPPANAVARYVPTEAIAIYVAILAGAFGPLEVVSGANLSTDFDFTSRWLFLAGSLVFTAGLVWLLYIGKARSEAGPYREVPVF